MPTPAYLMCSESGAADGNTNLLSFFNVLEKLRMGRVQGIPGMVQIVAATTFRATAVWLREATDAPENVFEARFTAILPNAAQEIELAQGTFQFGANEPFQRIVVLGIRFNEFNGPGLGRVEVRIRRQGEQDWQRPMSFPFYIEEVQLPQAVQPAPTERHD